MPIVQHAPDLLDPDRPLREHRPSMKRHMEWSDQTWNPVRGCSPVSAGCANCYAIPLASYVAGSPSGAGYVGLTRRTDGGHLRWSGEVRTAEDQLHKPLAVRTPTIWFLGAMTDLFHEAVPDAFLERLWQVMAASPRHTYQVLTKRPARMAQLCRPGGLLPRLEHVWLGTTVEHDLTTHRIDHLQQCDAAVRFLSMEPLVGPVSLPAPDSLAGIRLVIAGCETGRDARPMDEAWVRAIRDACAAQDVTFFYKQRRNAAGREEQGPMLDGQRHLTLPATHQPAQEATMR